jgi:hypothetical protein
MNPLLVLSHCTVAMRMCRLRALVMLEEAQD